jgi:TonB family protein
LNLFTNGFFITKNKMKTRKSPLRQVSLKLLLVLPLFLFTVLALNSCSASKKAGRLKTEIAPPPIVRDDEPFVVVEEMPLFQGGDSMLLAYIGKNTKYPEAAKLNNIQGRVIVRFCVTKEGGVNRISVLRGVSSELDTEAIRVVSTLPTFKPGKQGGKPVDVWYMVPITYALGKSSEALSLPPSLPPPPPPPPTPGNEDVFTQVEEMPVFKDGDAGLLKFICDSTKYPKEAKTNNISGKVIVKFIVEKDGSVSNAEILRGVNPSLDEESVRVVSSLPKFEKPGKQGGKAVRVNYMIPITFTLK